MFTLSLPNFALVEYRRCGPLARMVCTMFARDHQHDKHTHTPTSRGTPTRNTQPGNCSAIVRAAIWAAKTLVHIYAAVHRTYICTYINSVFLFNTVWWLETSSRSTNCGKLAQQQQCNACVCSTCVYYIPQQTCTYMAFCANAIGGSAVIVTFSFNACSELHQHQHRRGHHHTQCC